MRFFFLAACRLRPADRLHAAATGGGAAGAAAALRKAKECFPQLPLDFCSSIFITLDRLPPSSIAYCNTASPTRHTTHADM